MKFAHLADVHIGAWRDPRMASLPEQAFEEAFSIALAEKVDFILIAGDLFNTALPGIERLRAAVKTLQAAKAAGVAVYLIPGSHDFSPSGKSMLHVLEEAGLLVDVFKGEVVDGRLRLELTVDPKTGCALTGILGRKGMLDREHYDSLDIEELRARLSEHKDRVFLFHTALEELRPKELEAMEASPVSMLPLGFDYYAGGHVHIVRARSLEGYHEVVYPGPVFPASFSELEGLGGGNMVIVENNTPRDVPIRLKPVVALRLDVEGLSPAQATEKASSELRKATLEDAIVLLRLHGTLSEGSSADIDFRSLFSAAYASGAYFVMRNTVAVRSVALEDESFADRSATSIEEELIKESVGRVGNPFGDREAEVARSLLRSLSAEKAEGETNTVYEERVVEEAKRLLGLEDGR